jgi:hypothetical protein
MISGGFVWMCWIDGCAVWLGDGLFGYGRGGEAFGLGLIVGIGRLFAECFAPTILLV